MRRKKKNDTEKSEQHHNTCVLNMIYEIFTSRNYNREDFRFLEVMRPKQLKPRTEFTGYS